MIIARAHATATLLDDGDVLVAGGATRSSGADTADAELYHPASGTWSSAGPLATARYAATATVLGNGRVLITGGATTSAPPTPSAELYQPADPPSVTSLAPSNISQTGAQLRGTINPHLSDTTYHFELATDPTFASVTDVPAADADAGSGSGAVAVSQPATGLTPSTVYYERLVAANRYGTSSGTPAQQLTTAAAPTTTTSGAPTTPTSTPPVTTIGTTTTPSGGPTSPAPTTSTRRARLSAVAATDRTITWCAGCHYPSARIRFRLSRAATVRLALWARSRGRLQEVATTLVHGHSGLNSIRVAGRWHGQLVIARHVEVRVQTHVHHSWKTQRTLRFTVRSSY